MIYKLETNNTFNNSRAFEANKTHFKEQKQKFFTGQRKVANSSRLCLILQKKKLLKPIQPVEISSKQNRTSTSDACKIAAGPL